MLASVLLMYYILTNGLLVSADFMANWSYPSSDISTIDPDDTVLLHWSSNWKKVKLTMVYTDHSGNSDPSKPAIPQGTSCIPRKQLSSDNIDNYTRI
jgi:hypothetical protein